MDWIDLAEDREKWRAVMNAVTNVLVILAVRLAEKLLGFQEGRFVELFLFHIPFLCPNEIGIR